MNKRILNTETLRGIFDARRREILSFFFSVPLCLCGVIFAFSQSDGSQQNKTGRPGTFAIVGARVVPVSGPAIENGTVVIQNGKIVGVGVGIAVPAGAEKIDGKGLSIFP